MMNRIAANLPSALLFVALSVQAQDRIIAPVSGGGGGEFIARCPAGQVLGGVELRVGDDVDAIRPLCRTVSADVERVLVQGRLASDDRYQDIATYPLSDVSATTGWFGGSGGGGLVTITCDVISLAGVNRRVVAGMYIEIEGVDVVIVNRVTLLCEDLPATTSEYWRDQDFWSSRTAASGGTFAGPVYKAGDWGTYSRVDRGKSVCPGSSDGHTMVAVGIHGRAGKWLDALGVICAEPQLPFAVRPQARVRLAPGSTPTRTLTVCEAAVQARARNSPAAPGLESQCAASKAVKPVARTKLPDGTTPKSTLSKCEAAKQARARNSPAAPGLEAQCAVERANTVREQ